MVAQTIIGAASVTQRVLDLRHDHSNPYNPYPVMIFFNSIRLLENILS